MSKSSKESLFGITLTELVIILFFIMLLLSVFNIGELRDKVKELADQVPKSEDDTLPKSTITNIVFPDGELNTNLVSVEDIEDEIRSKEAICDFGKRFVELARNTYKFNDRRAAIKKEINNILNSEIVEEKIY